MSGSGGADASVDDSAPTDAIVIDCGSSITKVGYSGEDSPRAQYSTLIGLNSEKLETDSQSGALDPAAETVQKLFYGGDDAVSRRNALNLIKPVQRAEVTDWDALEKLWEWSFTEELNIDPEAFPVLVADSVLETKKSRETMAKIMFEKFNVKSFYVATQAVLSLFSSGVTSGLVIESGDEVSRAVPVFEGFALRHAVCHTRLANRNVYTNFGKALQAANPQHKLTVDMLDLGCLTNQLKAKHCCVDSYGGPGGGEEMEEAVHELPDGSVIHIPYSVCAGSAEVLFDPGQSGLRQTSLPGILGDCIATTAPRMEL